MKALKLTILFIFLSIGVFAQNYIGETSSTITSSYRDLGILPEYGTSEDGSDYMKFKDPNSNTTKLYYLSRDVCYMYVIGGEYYLLPSYINSLNSLGYKQSDGTWTIYDKAGTYTTWINKDNDNFFMILTITKTY